MAAALPPRMAALVDGDGAAPATAGRIPLPDPGADQLLKLHGRAVWARIAEHKPDGLRLPGQAILSFTVGPDGALMAAVIARSSGNADIDRLALLTLDRASPFPQPPAALQTAPSTFVITFQFR